MATTRRFDSDSGRSVATHPQQNETPPEEALLPCRWCVGLAMWKHLSLYGARCVPCYQQWLTEQGSGPTLNAQQRADLLKKLGAR